MSTLVVIPARLSAVRLPQKPLRLLAGLPLIVRVWERVSRMKVADRCVVATDDLAVAHAAEDAGAECVMTRMTHRSGTERVAEVASKEEFKDYDTIVNVQGDEPFIAESAVSGAAQVVASGRFPLGTAAIPAPRHASIEPSVVKVVVADDGRAMYFSRSLIPHRRELSQDGDQPDIATDDVVLQHVGVYAYSRPALTQWVALPEHRLERVERLEQLRALAAGIPIGVAVVDEPLAAGIDTEEDLSRANARWDSFIAGRD
jgi:3-deoxy-manno-octulosonate cytidylyltransferase (CMP-KDO synthetase)